MIILNVELTDDQYARYKAAYKNLMEMNSEPTDEQLIAQLKREASAITYAYEVADKIEPNWSY